MADIRLAMCETVAEFHACEAVQLAVWGGSEREIVPYDIMRAIEMVVSNVFSTSIGIVIRRMTFGQSSTEADAISSCDSVTI